MPLINNKNIETYSTLFLTNSCFVLVFSARILSARILSARFDHVRSAWGAQCAAIQTYARFSFIECSLAEIWSLIDEIMVYFGTIIISHFFAV